MYRIPWQKLNHPSGWIEITTRCQLSCEGCYRGCDNTVGEDAPFEKSKKEIDELIRIRNIRSITIAGGEPLLHPYLDEIVRYAKKRGLFVVVLTNGVLLNESRLRQLQRVGVSRIIAHVQAGQKRAKGDHIEDAEKTRSDLVELFRKVRTVKLGFLITVNRQTNHEIERMIVQTRQQSDIVKIVLFVMKQDVHQEINTAGSGTLNRPNLDILRSTMEKGYDLKFGAYLGRTIQEGYSWLIGGVAYAGTTHLGCVDSRFIQYLTELITLFSRRDRRSGLMDHAISLWRKWRLRSHLWAAVFSNRSALRIGWEWLSHSFRGALSLQIVVLLRTPEITPDGWDYCNGCPDMLLYNGQLVPSCLLEAIKCSHRVTLTRE